MNTYSSTKNGLGILKGVYPGKGPVGQMNAAHPMLDAIRKKRDALKTI